MKIIKKYKEQFDLRISDKQDFLEALFECLTSNTFNSDETVMLIYINNIYIEFNSIGSIIWTCIKKNMSEYEIVNFIAKKFKVDTNTVKNDVVNFLEGLVEKDIIKLEE